MNADGKVARLIHKASELTAAIGHLRGQGEIVKGRQLAAEFKAKQITPKLLAWTKARSLLAYADLLELNIRLISVIAELDNTIGHPEVSLQAFQDMQHLQQELNELRATTASSPQDLRQSLRHNNETLTGIRIKIAKAYAEVGDTANTIATLQLANVTYRTFDPSQIHRAIEIYLTLGCHHRIAYAPMHLLKMDWDQRLQRIMQESYRITQLLNHPEVPTERLKLLTTENHLIIQDWTVSLTTLAILAPTYEALGLYKQAYRLYTKLANYAPQNLGRHTIAWHLLLDKARSCNANWLQYSADEETPPFFKLGAIENTTANPCYHALAQQMQHQFALLTELEQTTSRKQRVKREKTLTAKWNWPQQDLPLSTANPHVTALLHRIVLPIAKYVHYNARGYVYNTRQVAMAAIAITQIAQTCYRKWILHQDQPIAKAFPDLLHKCPDYTPSKAHQLDWDTIYEIAVRWRRISEPSQAIWWMPHPRYRREAKLPWPSVMPEDPSIPHSSPTSLASLLAEDLPPLQNTPDKTSLDQAKEKTEPAQQTQESEHEALLQEAESTLQKPVSQVKSQQTAQQAAKAAQTEAAKARQSTLHTLCREASYTPAPGEELTLTLYSSLNTPIIKGDCAPSRYAPNWAKAMEMLRDAAQKRMHNLAARAASPDKRQEAQRKEMLVLRAKSPQELYNIVQTPITMTTWMTSLLTGKRLSILGTEFNINPHYEPAERQKMDEDPSYTSKTEKIVFDIQTTQDTVRLQQIAIELQTLQHLLADLAQRKLQAETAQNSAQAHLIAEAMLDTISDLTFYWCNLMPFTRGSAMVGAITLLALLLAAGITPIADQCAWTAEYCLDWAALLEQEPKLFRQSVRTNLLKPGSYTIATTEQTAWILDPAQLPDIAATYHSVATATQLLNLLSVQTYQAQESSSTYQPRA